MKGTDPQVEGISRTSSPTSTCPSPATSLENLSSAESEWSTSSGWSFPSSAPPSRVCSPQLLYPSPSDSPPPPAKVDYSAIIQLAFKSANKVVPPSATFNTQESSYHEVGDTDACGSEIGPSRRKKRIPRPPNAFMLFRAKEVNARLPYDLENRQQLVSVIAGHAWNLLKESDKAVWKEMSKTIQAEHMEKYPDYKFSPSRKPGRKDQVGGGADGQLVETREDFQRRLREKYLKIVGPSVASPRTRKPKKSRKAAVGKQSSIMLPSLLPTPLFSQPSEVPQTSAFNSTDGLSSHNPALYMPSTLSLPAGVPPPHIAFSGFDWSAIVPHIPNDNLLTTQPSASASSQAGSLHEDPHILSDLIDNEKVRSPLPRVLLHS